MDRLPADAGGARRQCRGDLVGRHRAGHGADRPGTGIADFVRGYPTGGVYQWRPGDTRFRLLRGTELPGNNGLETSRDDRFFYVVAFGWHSIFVYARAETSQPVRRILAADFMPDNIHWSGGHLLTAGMRYREPACGGLRRIVDGAADPMLCHRGYVVAELNPIHHVLTRYYAAQ